MYRVFLFLAFLAYCSSVSFIRKPFINEQNDVNDLVDSDGAGYSYFKKQQIDARPLAQASLDIPIQDLSAYMQGSAFKQQPIFTDSNNQFLNNDFGQQQLIPRSNIQPQNFLPRTVPIQQPISIQRDFSQLPLTIFNGYDTPQANRPVQSKFLTRNTFGNQQQILAPQTTFNGYGNQQQDLSFIQQPWNTQQQSIGYSSSFGGQGQQPVSSGFFIQSNQDNDQVPVTNAVFMSSQVPPQRFISQSQPKQQIFNNGW